MYQNTPSAAEQQKGDNPEQNRDLPKSPNMSPSLLPVSQSQSQLRAGGAEFFNTHAHRDKSKLTLSPHNR